jgi:sec-independent protein translocase protein TatB
MPSLADSAVIFILALMLFGPKKLPQLARQLGKLMAEFRRASNEFRMQMEDELRVEEQKEHEAKVAAMSGPETTATENAGPQAIAESGELKMMPPSTGLPVQAGNGYPGPDFTEHPLEPHPHDEPPHVDPNNSILNAGVSSDEPIADEVAQDAAHEPHQKHA